VSALFVQSRYSHDTSYVVELWDDISPNIKNKLGLSQDNVGVDSVLFQIINGVKLPISFCRSISPTRTQHISSDIRKYISLDLTHYIKNEDINQTILCYYICNEAYLDQFNIRPLQKIEFITPEHTKLGLTRINFHERKYLHTTMSNEQFDYFIQKAINLKVPEIDNPDMNKYI
jgi:hypothetical protein